MRGSSQGEHPPCTLNGLLQGRTLITGPRGTHHATTVLSTKRHHQQKQHTRRNACSMYVHTQAAQRCSRATSTLSTPKPDIWFQRARISWPLLPASGVLTYSTWGNTRTMLFTAGQGGSTSIPSCRDIPSGAATTTSGGSSTRRLSYSTFLGGGSPRHTVQGTQYTVHSTQYTVHSTQYTLTHYSRFLLLPQPQAVTLQGGQQGLGAVHGLLHQGHNENQVAVAAGTRRERETGRRESSGRSSYHRTTVAVPRCPVRPGQRYILTLHTQKLHPHLICSASLRAQRARAGTSLRPRTVSTSNRGFATDKPGMVTTRRASSCGVAHGTSEFQKAT